MSDLPARDASTGPAGLLAAGARLMLPAVWLGLIVGISLIEAPLKFQAPGITIPLGLGIGRLVFGAMNVVEIVIFLAWLAASLGRRLGRGYVGLVATIGAVLALKVFAIRPPLNQRTDRVLAGLDDGGSIWHYLYIAADGLLLVLLAGALVLGVRRWIKVR
jgi:hypothetical protein